MVGFNLLTKLGLKIIFQMLAASPNISANKAPMAALTIFSRKLEEFHKIYMLPINKVIMIAIAVQHIK